MFYAIAIIVACCQIAQRFGTVLLCGFLEPFSRFLVIFGNAVTFDVEEPRFDEMLYVELDIRISLGMCLEGRSVSRISIVLGQDRYGISFVALLGRYW